MGQAGGCCEAERESVTLVTADAPDAEDTATGNKNNATALGPSVGRMASTTPSELPPDMLAYEQNLTTPPPPVPEGNEKTGTVVFEFRVPEDGRIEECMFTSKPLGMNFANTLPLTVIKIAPGSEAQKQGVQTGWIFTKAGGVELEGMTLNQIVPLIRDKSANLPGQQSTTSPTQSALTFEFVFNGEAKRVTFEKRPLGMSFANKLPLTVTKIAAGSEAQRLGVEPGWVFSKVGDVSLSDMDDKAQILALILQKSTSLPDESKKG